MTQIFREKKIFMPGVASLFLMSQWKSDAKCVEGGKLLISALFMEWEFPLCAKPRRDPGKEAAKNFTIILQSIFRGCEII